MRTDAQTWQANGQILLLIVANAPRIGELMYVCFHISPTSTRPNCVTEIRVLPCAYRSGDVLWYESKHAAIWGDGYRGDSKCDIERQELCCCLHLQISHIQNGGVAVACVCTDVCCVRSCDPCLLHCDSNVSLWFPCSNVAKRVMEENTQWGTS